jgi:hypothetical protein
MFTFVFILSSVVLQVFGIWYSMQTIHVFIWNCFEIEEIFLEWKGILQSLQNVMLWRGLLHTSVTK